MIYATLYFCAAVGNPCKGVDVTSTFPDIDACYNQSQLYAAEYLARHKELEAWYLAEVSCSGKKPEPEGQEA